MDYDLTLTLPGTEDRATVRFTGQSAQLWVAGALLLTGPREAMEQMADSLTARTQRTPVGAG